MGFEWLLPLFVVVLFLATLTRSTFGFGDALVAMPVLGLFADLDLIRPVVALVSVTIASVIVATDWRHVELRTAWRFVVASLVGIAAGLAFWELAIPVSNRQTAQIVVKLALGAVIVAFAVWRLAAPKAGTLPGHRFAFVFGFCAGVLGQLFNIPGPPLVIYGTLKRWPAEQFRATLQGYAMVATSAVAGSHALQGLWKPQVFWLYLAAVAPALLALVLGRWLNRVVKKRGFARLISILLIVVGSMLIVQSAWQLVQHGH